MEKMRSLDFLEYRNKVDFYKRTNLNLIWEFPVQMDLTFFWNDLQIILKSIWFANQNQDFVFTRLITFCRCLDIRGFFFLFGHSSPEKLQILVHLMKKSNKRQCVLRLKWLFYPLTFFMKIFIHCKLVGDH